MAGFCHFGQGVSWDLAKKSLWRRSSSFVRVATSCLSMFLNSIFFLSSFRSSFFFFFTEVYVTADFASFSVLIFHYGWNLQILSKNCEGFLHFKSAKKIQFWNSKLLTKYEPNYYLQPKYEFNQQFEIYFIHNNSTQL